MYWGENGNLNINVIIINVIIGLWKHFLFSLILTLFVLSNLGGNILPLFSYSLLKNIGI